MLLYNCTKVAMISCDLCLVLLSNSTGSAYLCLPNFEEMRVCNSLLWIVGMAGAIYIKGVPVTNYKRRVAFSSSYFVIMQVQHCVVKNTSSHMTADLLSIPKRSGPPNTLNSLLR